MLVALKELICVDAAAIYGSICKGYIFATQKWLVGMDSPNHAWHAR